MTAPVVLVIDDVHLVRNSECRAALSVLADHVPRGSRLVLAGRDRPPLLSCRRQGEPVSASPSHRAVESQ
jgi:ATP/maltotriose-dependent transcriptional regulator MalT